VGCLTGQAEWLEVLLSLPRLGGARDVGYRLRRLSNRNCRDNAVLKGVDGVHRVLILETDIHASAVAGWPDAVTELADWNGGGLFEIASTKGVCTENLSSGVVVMKSAQDGA
jgi:hypothetical protein